MKRLKNRLTASILAVVMLATLFTVPVSADAQATASVTSDALYALDLLNVLGITEVAQGDDLGAKISRAEFAALITRFVGVYDPVVSDAVKFKDVLPGSFYEPYITTAAASGYMQAVNDDYFYPAWEISAVDAARAFLMSLGYKGIAGNNETFLSFVNRLDLYDGVDTQNFTRGEVYKMMYNALNAPIMEQTGFGDEAIYEQMKDITALYRYHDVIRSEGVITGADGVVLGSGGRVELEDGMIELDGTRFVSPGYDLASILGREVYLYWNDIRGSSIDSAIHVEVIEDNALTLSADKIIDFASNTYEYAVDDKKTKKISLDTPYVIYNGEEYTGAYTKDIMVPDSGDVTIVENIKGSRDLVIIREFTDVLVKIVINDDYEKVIIGEDGERYDVGTYEENVKYYNESGIASTLGEVEAGNVISVSRSATGRKTTIYISTTVVSDALTSYDDEKWTLGEKEYYISASLKDAIKAGTQEVPSFGKSYDYHLNINGEIAFCKESGSALADGQFYGILTGVSTGAGGFDNTISVKVWSKTMGGFEIYEVADKLELNCERADKKEVADALKRNGRDGDMGTEIVAQPVKIGLNSENKVNYLCQAASNNDDGKGFFYYMGSSQTRGNYFQYRNVLIYSNSGGTDFSNAPVNNGNLSIGVGERTEYVQVPFFKPESGEAIGKIDVDTEKAFISRSKPSGTTSFIVYKENDEDLVASYVICATASGEKEHCETTVNIHCVVSISNVVADGEVVTQIKTNRMTYYLDNPKIDLNALKIWQSNQSSTNVTAWIDPETGVQGVHKVVPGDLVNISADSLGYIQAMEIVYDCTNNRMMGKGTGTTSSYGYINTDVAWYSRSTEINLLLLNVLYTKDGYICATDAKDPADYIANPMDHRRYVGKIPAINCIDMTGRKITTRNAVNADLIGYNDSADDYATVILSHRYAQQTGGYVYKKTDK